MCPAIQIRAMTRTDVAAVTAIYAEIYNSSYISFGELSAGLALAPGVSAPDALDRFQAQLTAQFKPNLHVAAGLFVAVEDLAGDPVGDPVGDTMETEAIVGFAIASLRKTETAAVELWLEDLGVSPPNQGQGIGHTLIKTALNWGQAHGATYYLLESGLQNQTAHRVFQSMGFQPMAMVFYKAVDHESITP